MANTYSLISSKTIGAGGQSSIEFTSIPGIYTDLIIKASIRGTGTGSPNISLDINGVSTGRTTRWIQGNGTGTVSSYGFSDADIATANTTSQTASIFTNTEIYFANYASANSKGFISENAQENNNAVATYIEVVGGFWSGTSAITSLKLYITGQDIAQHSTAYLYGISNA
jgi:hypothetical protein